MKWSKGRGMREQWKIYYERKGSIRTQLYMYENVTINQGFFVMLNNILNNQNNDKIVNTISSVIFTNDDLTESVGQLCTKNHQQDRCPGPQRHWICSYCRSIRKDRSAFPNGHDIDHVQSAKPNQKYAHSSWRNAQKFSKENKNNFKKVGKTLIIRTVTTNFLQNNLLSNGIHSSLNAGIFVCFFMLLFLFACLWSKDFNTLVLYLLQ